MFAGFHDLSLPDCNSYVFYDCVCKNLTPNMKGVGMLVILLRGVNFGFRSHLGCSWQTPSCLAVKVSFRVAREKNVKILYCLCFNMVSFRGPKKLEPRPNWSPLGVLFQNFSRASPPRSYAESSPPPPEVHLRERRL